MGGRQGRPAPQDDDAQGRYRVINLQFFPSRQLALYTVRLFLTRSFAVLVGLVLVLMMLDLLGESGKILAVPGNGDAELWRYVGLRIPLLISRFLPFSVLLGTLIAFVGLNQNSEVVAMKAAGISAHQMLAPLVIASLGVSVLAFVFNETVVVHSARVVNAWSDNDYKPVPPESGILSNVWVTHGGDLVRARVAAGQGNAFRVQGVTIYQRNHGAIQRIIDADRAAPDGAQWRLDDVRVYDSAMNLVRKVPTMKGLAGLTPDQLRLAKVNPDETSFFQLFGKISEMEAAGKATAEARAGLWHKISGPLSVVLMPLLAAVAAFGLARSGQVLLRASVGMALGFAYFVADNFSLAMGNVGAYPPILAAWAPFFLFLLVGETVLIRSEE
jgi:lipopolysaccharide export system permease protein